MIVVDKLTVAFGRGEGAVQAVRQASFRVGAGESFGLVGESGSGKSTVLRALAGLNPDWTGALSLAGAKLTPHRPREFYKRVQMVFQDPYASLHPRQTVDRLLAEPLAIHGLGGRGGRGGVGEASADAKIQRVLADVGLGGLFRYRYPHQLSGGQRQRVAIARALILEPEVLLLDEPTSALDVSVQAEILNLLQRLRRERGLTYILVSHNLAVVAHMCDRLAVMNRGRIVEEMTVAALRAAAPREAYTRQLLAASHGYSRAAAAELRDFE